MEDYRLRDQSLYNVFTHTLPFQKKKLARLTVNTRVLPMHNFEFKYL